MQNRSLGIVATKCQTQWDAFLVSINITHTCFPFSVFQPQNPASLLLLLLIPHYGEYSSSIQMSKNFTCFFLLPREASNVESSGASPKLTHWGTGICKSPYKIPSSDLQTLIYCKTLQGISPPMDIPDCFMAGISVCSSCGNSISFVSSVVHQTVWTLSRITLRSASHQCSICSTCLQLKVLP